jgi:hypothetical protein
METGECRLLESSEITNVATLDTEAAPVEQLEHAKNVSVANQSSYVGTVVTAYVADAPEVPTGT